MHTVLKWGLAAVAAGLVFSGSFILTDQVNPSSPTQKIPPQPELPKNIDNLFEHVILNQQVHDNYNTDKLKQHCAELEPCAAHQALFARYLSFKEALLALQQTLAHLPLNQQLSELIDFQQRYFSKEEIKLLFADDNQMQRYTLAKLEIKQDDSLSPALKKQLLANLKAAQPEHITQALKPSENLASLNSQFKQALQDHDYNQLAGTFGDAAATRLIALEKRKTQWQHINKQLTKKIAQLKQHYTGEQLDKQVSALLEQHLTPNQQRRFLALHPQT